MQYITDPAFIEELESTGAPQGASPVSNEQDDGSIFKTAGANIQSQIDAMIAAQASPEMSNYATYRLKRSIGQMREEQSKLGVAGNIAAGAISAAPAIAAGIANPMLGGVVGAHMAGSEALIQQMEQQGELDTGAAMAAGLGTGLVDTAMGGFGNVARGALSARAAAKAGSALPVAAPLAQRAAVAATEDVTSNVAAQAMTNLASGQDWDTGLGEAAAFGVAGGAAVRGSLAGLNRAAGYALNDGGRKGIDNVQRVADAGIPVDKNFANEAIAYDNLYKQTQSDIQNARTPEELDTAIEASLNMSAEKSSQAAVINAMKIADEYGIPFTDAGFNVDLNIGLSRSSAKHNIGENLGVTKKQMIDAASASENVRHGYFGHDKAVERGLTKEAYQKQVQDSYKNADSVMKGSYDANVSIVEKMIREAETSPDITRSELQQLGQLATSLRHLNADMKTYTGRQKLDTSVDILNSSREAMRLANALGIQDKLQGIDGKPGNWDPVGGIRTIDVLEQMVRANTPNVHESISSIGRDTGRQGGGAGDMAMDALLGSISLGLPVVRRAAKEVSGQMSKSRLRKAKETGISRVKGLAGAIPASRAKAGLDAGDLGAAAKGAEADLADLGLTPPVAEPAPVATPAVEAPVATVEQPAPVSKPLTVSTPKAPQKAVQAAPEPAPAPTPEKMARKPRTVKKAKELEESKAAKVEEVVPEKVEVQDVTPKKSRALSPDKVERVEKKAAPEPEAPKKPTDVKEMAKKPTAPKKEEKPVEAEPEAPKKVEEEAPPAEEKAKTSVTDLVRNPLKKKADKLDSLSPKERAAMPTAELRELRRAKEDLQDIDSLSDGLASQHKMTKDAVVEYIAELGGMDGLRKANKDAGHEASNIRKFLSNRIKELEDLKKIEVKNKLDTLKNQIQKKIEPIQGDKSIEASRIANKHGVTRSRLEAAGYDKDVIEEALKRGGAENTSNDFDPATVNRWASTLNKRKTEDAKVISKEAEIKAKQAAEQAKLKDQKWLANQYLKGLKVDTDPELRGIVESVLGKGRGKPVTDQQMQALFNKMDSHLENQKTAYEGSFKKGGESAPLDKAKAATYESMQRTLKENRAKADAEAKAARQDAEDAVKEAQQKTADYEKLFDQAEKNMKKFDDIQKLDSQIKEMTDSLIDMDAPEHFVQQAIHNTFIKRDTPLNDRELNKTRAKVVTELEKLMNADVVAAKAQVKPTIQKMNEGELIAAREEIMSSTVDNISEPQNQAIIQSLTEELKARGLRRDQEIMTTFNDVVVKAEHMQRLYPDNPEWWIPADAVDSIQKSFGKGEASSFAGPLLRRLREKFYGTSEGTEKYYRNTQKKIDREIKGKEATGLGDVIVK